MPCSTCTCLPICTPYIYIRICKLHVHVPPHATCNVHMYICPVLHVMCCPGPILLILHWHLTSYIIVILDHAQVLCLVSHLHLFPIPLLLCTFDCAWDGSAWDADQIAHTHTHIAGLSMFDVYPLQLRLGGLGGEHAPRAWKTQHREENRKTSTFANNQTRFHHLTSHSWGRSLCLFIHLGTAPKKDKKL